MKEDKLRLVKLLNKSSVLNSTFKKFVVLEEEDSFDENDSAIVLSPNEYEKIQSKLSDYENKINLLQNELLDEKNKLIDSKEEIQNLHDKISKIDDERVAIYQELDYKNKMILAYNVEINKSIFDVIDKVVDEARINITERNHEFVNEINKKINKTKIEVNERNKAIAFDINKTVDEINEEIRNTNIIKMMLYKNKINLNVSTDDLIKPFEFDFDPNELLSSNTLELDTSEIIKKVMPKLPEPFSKYIKAPDNDKIIDLDNEDD